MVQLLDYERQNLKNTYINNSVRYSLSGYSWLSSLQKVTHRFFTMRLAYFFRCLSTFLLLPGSLGGFQRVGHMVARDAFEHFQEDITTHDPGTDPISCKEENAYCCATDDGGLGHSLTDLIMSLGINIKLGCGPCMYMRGEFQA